MSEASVVATVAVFGSLIVGFAPAALAQADPVVCEQLRFWGGQHYGPMYITDNGDVWLNMGLYYEKIYDCPPYEG